MTKPATMISFSLSQRGSPYIFGSRGQPCTPAYRRERFDAVGKDHPTIKTKCPVLMGTAKNCEGCRYNGKRCYDCRGLTYIAAQTVGILLYGSGATDQYNLESNWDRKGPISEMPRDKVCCVFRKKGDRMEHTALYIADGTTVEASSGVERNSLAAGRWTHYGINRGLYTQQELEAEPMAETYAKIGTAIIQTAGDAGLSLWKEPEKITPVGKVAKREVVDVYDNLQKSTASPFNFFRLCGYKGIVGFADDQYLSEITPVAPDSGNTGLSDAGVISAWNNVLSARDALVEAVEAFKPYMR